MARKEAPRADKAHSKDPKSIPDNTSGSPGDAAPSPVPAPGSPDYQFPGVLGVVETLGGLPAVIAELRDVEQVPREAAKLYGDLLEDVLSLELGKRTLVEEVLEEHFEQLNEKGIAGIRPPEIVEESWRALREESVGKVVDDVTTILWDVAPEPKLIEDVLSLVEKPESEVGNSEAESGGLLPLDIVTDLVPVLPKIKTPLKLPLLP
ncbi:MAG: hypothetical protein EOP84_14505 [Verrucomicrobiaceae bacterium]|nr:MAG: hypothetical protein EOP84_14505 [Verrucomicrobiaceae bacterium]